MCVCVCVCVCVLPIAYYVLRMPIYHFYIAILFYFEYWMNFYDIMPVF